jgi:predicted dienelactone hydrolase
MRALEVLEPVAVRWGDADEIAPPDENARRYATLIPDADARSAAPDVDHHEFLADNPDREDVRRRVAADAVASYRTHLARG